MSYNQDRDGDSYGSTRNNYSQDDSSSGNNYGSNNRLGSPLLLGADDNRADTITLDHPITMNPRPALMLQTTIHTPAATNHPTLTTASGPQTDIVQTILFLAPIRTSAVTSRQILPAPLGHQI
jgi:hypothetical protein